MEENYKIEHNLEKALQALAEGKICIWRLQLKNLAKKGQCIYCSGLNQCIYAHMIPLEEAREYARIMKLL